MSYFSNSSLDTLLLGSRMVIFDMNGLIVDDEQLQLTAMNRVLNAFSVMLSEEYWARYCAGTRSEDFTRRILEENGIPHTQKTVYELVNKKNELYRKLIVKVIKSVTRPGVLELISHVSEVTHQTLALATTASELEIEAILGKAGLHIKDYFQYIASGSDISRCKPDPEIYRYVSGIARVATANCLVFEDSNPGVLAASRAGMQCIAVPNRFTAGERFNNATFIVNNLTRDAKILNHGDFQNQGGFG
jgi:HAD superfamily hydrolase (TIGR01509 family)